MSFFDWLILLSIILSRSIHVTNGKSSFFFYGQIVFHYVNISQLFNPLIDWWVRGLLPNLGYCKLCYNEQSGAHIFFQSSVLGFFRYISWSRIAGSKEVPFLIFWGNSILLSTVAAPVCIPTNSTWRFFLISTSLSTLVVYWFIDDSHPDWCETIPGCGFNLHLSDD